MENILLQDLKEHFHSLQAVRTKALGNEEDNKGLFAFLLKDSKHKDAYKDRFFSNNTFP